MSGKTFNGQMITRASAARSFDHSTAGDDAAQVSPSQELALRIRKLRAAAAAIPDALPAPAAGVPVAEPAQLVGTPEAPSQSAQTDAEERDAKRRKIL